MFHPNVVPSQFPRASEDMGHKCGVCVCVRWVNLFLNLILCTNVFLIPLGTSLLLVSF